MMTMEAEVVCVTDLHCYFVESVRVAAAHQELAVGEATVSYLGGMLTRYTHAESLYDRTADGVVRTPLALIYKAAAESGSERERRVHLQRLGDVALFISGVFSGCLRRSLVDIDYYVSMGESAYGYLAGPGGDGGRERALPDVFAELSRRFVDFGDLLAEVCEVLRASEENDPARLDELWVRTGSRRVGRLLGELGIASPRTRSRGFH